MTQARRIDLPGADVVYAESFPIGMDPAEIMRRLTDEIPWEQRSIRIQGREIPQPRLVAWFGDPGTAYTYSGLTLEPHPWTPLMQSIKEAVESATGENFNSALLNLYRGSRDSIGFHSDDEPELGPEPTIASVSLGGERTFSFKPKFDRSAKPIGVRLASGSLLVMRGKTQKTWLHGIEKEKVHCDPRINITFRRIRR